LFVLGLDGVPLSLLTGETGRRMMPVLSGLLDEGACLPLCSVVPTVSSVAWATYSTGTNPGKHGIFGYVDRHPNPFTALIPTARDLKQPTLWEHLSRLGQRVGVMNVPLTYPPKAVNGFMVACFMSPELASATYPVELAPRLMEMDYRLDADTSLAREDLEAFAQEAKETLARRFQACFELMSSESWDFFQLNVTSTDRINHFLWGYLEEGDHPLAAQFLDFYRRLDSYIGELTAKLASSCHLVILSDHGFTRLKGEVYLNQWLQDNGYLVLGRGQHELKNMHAGTKAYSLAPGRIYLNVAGREEKGSVETGHAYEDLREELIHRIEGLTEPQSGEPLVAKVHKREEIYTGAHLSRAADLIVEPARGYEFKANLGAPSLVSRGAMTGAHSKSDAFFFVAGGKAPDQSAEITLLDAAPTICSLLKVPVPGGMDGRSLI
jgi:predicted AlkP superfamily phosphohydrolase/phosphomutase